MPRGVRVLREGAPRRDHGDTAEEAERIFEAFSEGADIKMPMERTFWAERFGMLIDRFGTAWIINGNLQSDDENEGAGS